ncbi:hypothetical protein Tco_0557200 [Tanacetum coccineum]
MWSVLRALEMKSIEDLSLMLWGRGGLVGAGVKVGLSEAREINNGLRPSVVCTIHFSRSRTRRGRYGASEYPPLLAVDERSSGSANLQLIRDFVAVLGYLCGLCVVLSYFGYESEAQLAVFTEDKTIL